MTAETLYFKILLDSQYQIDPPIADIYVNDNHIQQLTVSKLTACEFVHEFTSGSNTLRIVKSGKNYDDPTSALILAQLDIDSINLQRIIYNNSKFYPVYPDGWKIKQQQLGIDLETYIVGDTFFGFDGVWQLEFEIPYVDFLIRNMA